MICFLIIFFLKKISEALKFVKDLLNRFSFILSESNLGFLLIKFFFIECHIFIIDRLLLLYNNIYIYIQLKKLNNTKYILYNSSRKKVI